MCKISYHPRRCYSHSDLTLLYRAEQASATPFTVGGRWLNRRMGLPHRLANTIADLAGIAVRLKD